MTDPTNAARASEPQTPLRWWLIFGAPVIVPAVIAWIIVSAPFSIWAAVLGVLGHQREAAWLWNHTGMSLLMGKEKNLG